jgi:hypothetical protein
MLSMPVGFGLLCLQYIAEILKLASGAGAAQAVEEHA